MAEKVMFMLCNEAGGKYWEGADRKALRSLDLPDGNYTLWKYAGTFSMKVVPAVKRVHFDRAVKKGPRKPRPPMAGGVFETVVGEPLR